MNGLFLLTIKELFSKKIILTIFVLATVFCLTLVFALNIKIGGMDSKIILDIFGQTVQNNLNTQSFDAETILGYIQSGIAVAIFFVSLFISLFATSSLFPDMLKKGNIDLILSKPLSRQNIFFQRFMGALTLVAMNVFYIIIFSWIILSLKFQIWNFNFLFSGLIIISFFFNIFAIMTLVAMLLKNGVISLMLTYFIVFILSPIIAAVERFAVLDNSFYKIIVGVLHNTLPKVSETVILINSVVTSKEVSFASLWSSVLIGFLAVGLSLVIFRRTDF